MSTKIRFPLRSKLIVFGGLLALVPAVAIGIGLMNVNEVTLEVQSREMRLAVASELTSFIERSYREVEEKLQLGQQILTDPRIDDESRINAFTAIIEAQNAIEKVAIYNKDGTYAAQIHKSGTPFTEEDLPADLLTRASQERTALAGPMRNEKGLYLDLVIAIRSESSEISGFLRTHFSLKDDQDEVTSVALARLDPESRIDVSNLSGEILMSSVPTDIGKSNVLEIANAPNLAQRLETIYAQSVAQSGETSDGEDLVTLMPLKTFPAVVQVSVPIRIAYASLYRMRWIVAIGTFLAVIIAMVCAYVMAEQISRPLRLVTRFTKKLGARAFGERVEVNTSDEIKVVADSLNAAAQELQESEEAIAKEIEIRSDLSRYLPLDLVDSIVARQAEIALGGERRTVSVLFADIVRFTPLCESHQPEVVVSLLNELFTLITTIIFETGGTVDKFIGDCVMAFWGAPQPDEDHVIHALTAAEKILRLLEVGNERWREAYGVEIEIAIGVNTGEAIIGNIGSEKRMEYTAIGKTINEAARLEGLARPSQILVTQAVVQQAEDLFDFYEVSEEVLHFGGQATRIFEVVT